MAHELDKHQLDRNDFKFVDVFNKGKKTRTWTCLHTDDTFTYTDGDGKTSNDLKGFLDKCMMAKKEGKKTIKEVGYAGTLKQAPDNQWMLIQDTDRYGIKKGLDGKPTIVRDKNIGLGRITRVTGEIVYLRDSIMGLTPYLKSTKGAGNFPYIPLKDEKTNKLVFEPYYAWVIRHEKDYQKENPEMLALAKNKMGVDAIAAIEAGKYTYAFDAAEAGQVDLETADNALLDDVRYSVSGDSRDLYTVDSLYAPVFVLNKEKDVVSISKKTLTQGKKVKGLGKVSKKFRFRFFKMLNYDGNLFFPVKKLKKISEGVYQVKEQGKSMKIVNGKIVPINAPLTVGTTLKGIVVNPIIEKNFTFVILNDNNERTFFVNKKNLKEMISKADGSEDDDSYNLTYGGNVGLLQKYKDATSHSNFEGGDIEEFHGGDVNFSGNNAIEVRTNMRGVPSFLRNDRVYPRYVPSVVKSYNADVARVTPLVPTRVSPIASVSRQIVGFDGSERVVGFDSNVEIPSDEFDNTKIYFNFLNNTDLKLGSLENNADLQFNMDGSTNAVDLNFDADDEDVSNAIGDWFKNLFDKSSIGKKEITPTQAKKLADPNKVEYTPEEVKVMYQKSGSKKPLGEWLKSDSSKQFLNSLTQIGYLLLLNKSQGGAAPDNTKQDNQDVGGYGGGDGAGSGGSNDDEQKDKKILGMHPVTFGIVTVVGLAAVGLGIWFIRRKK